MKKKLLFGFMAVMLVAGTILAGCAAPAPEGVTPTPAPAEPEVIEWTMSCHCADSPTFGYWGEPGVKYNRMMHSMMDRGYAEWIGDVTNGRLKITTVEPGSIFPPGESVENVGAGAIEASFVAEYWIVGTVPECYIVGGLPYSIPSAAAAFDLWFNYGWYDIMCEVYDELNLVFVPVPLSEVSGLITAYPCPTLADVKGKNYRVFGPMGKAIEALGGNGLVIAFADQYMAMQLGTIDGATTAAISLESAKLKEVCMGFVTYPKLYTATDALLINKDAFNALPEDLQKTIMDYSHQYFMAASLVEGMQQKWVVARAKEEYGMKEWKWSEEDTLKATELCREKVWPYFGAMNPRNQKLLDLMISFMHEHGWLE